jgi:hypothetical protein
MSTVRRRGLQIDDPLGADQPTHASERSTEAGCPTASEVPADGQRGEPQSGRQDETGTPLRHTSSPGRQPATRDVWRAWSGITGVGSSRLPHELLVELSDNARELGLPIGMIATAAITQLLDQPPEQIAELIDRADDARIHGRRNARRRLTKRTEG